MTATQRAVVDDLGNINVHGRSALEIVWKVKDADGNFLNISASDLFVEIATKLRIALTAGEDNYSRKLTLTRAQIATLPLNQPLDYALHDETPSSPATIWSGLVTAYGFRTAPSGAAAVDPGVSSWTGATVTVLQAESVPTVVVTYMGATGYGVPTGGTSGQYLRKNSSTEFDWGFDTITSADVSGLDAQLAALQTAIDARVQMNLLNSAAFWNKANADTGDIWDLTIGDSTGNDASEWVRAGKVAYYCAQFPTYTVKYRTFSLSTGWAAYSTIQTGTGSNTIWVDNASVGGTSPSSYMGAVELLIFNDEVQYDNIDISLGQNLATAPVVSVKTVVELFTAFVGRIRHLQPAAGIFLLLPSTDRTSAGATQKSKNAVAGLTRVAALLGCGLIDVYNAYLAAGNADSLYSDPPTDLLHPSVAGTAKYTAAWEASHGDPGTALQTGPGVWTSPYDTPRPLLLDNADFSIWPDGQTGPTGWTFTNCTPSKDSAKAGLGKYALKLTNAGAAAKISRSLTAILGEIRGRTINVAATLWIPAGFDKTLTGRLFISNAAGTISEASLAFVAGWAEGYWIEQMLTISVPADAADLSAGVYAGPSGSGDVGEELWIKSIRVSYGLLPAPVMDPTQPDAIIVDASGLESAVSLPLRAAMNADGTAAVAGAGQFGVALTGGPPPTAQYLLGENAQGNTKTDVAWWELVVPSDYRSGQDLALATNVEVVIGSGVMGSSTLTVWALEKTTAGALGSNLISSNTSPIGTTNLFTYSQDFTNGVYSNSNITVTGGQTDPFGGSDASKLETTTTAATAFSQTKAVTGTDAIGSVYVKKGSGTGDLGRFILRNATTATNLVGITLDYDTGAFPYSPGTTGATVESVGGFWRVSLTAGITSGDSVQFYIGAAGSSTAAGQFIYAYGAQLQAGSVLGPYVATTSVAVTGGAAAAYNFTIDGTDLVAGDVLLIGVQAAIVETGAANPIYGRINSVQVS